MVQPIHTKAEIASLEEVLSNVEVMPSAMCVSEFDGFIAGLLLCPEMIMPSEWLPEVWGSDGEPAFDSMKQAQETIGAVMAHYNRVAECLANPAKPYDIVLEEDDTDGTPFWEFWVSGFFQAMRLRPKAWHSYLETSDPEAKEAFVVMVSLIDLEAGESKLPKDLQEELEDTAAASIAGLVVKMNRWMKSQSPILSSAEFGGTQQAANRNIGPASSTKVGRNELCPCGSGKKHKKCCGAN
jgi:uncharacterized protein